MQKQALRSDKRSSLFLRHHLDVLLRQSKIACSSTPHPNVFAVDQKFSPAL
jgi:hypothetical protein